ncbi:Uncharacterized protein QTN25_007879 [Entamoeba marina]
MTSSDITKNYINQLTTHLLLNISNKNAAIVFYHKHQRTSNPAVQQYLTHLQSYFGITPSDLLQVDGLEDRSAVVNTLESSPSLFSEWLKSTSTATKTEFVSKNTRGEFSKTNNATIIPNVCSEQQITHTLAQHTNTIQNMQLAMKILKQEVIKTNMKLQYPSHQLTPSGTSSVLMKTEEDDTNTTTNHSVFVFQIVTNDKNVERTNQIKESLDPVSVYDFWDGYSLGISPKVVVVIVESLEESLGQDIQLIHSIYEQSKIYVIYLHKKGCLVPHLKEKEFITMEFDVQRKNGLFAEDQTYRKVINYCFK